MTAYDIITPSAGDPTASLCPMEYLSCLERSRGVGSGSGRGVKVNSILWITQESLPIKPMLVTVA